MQDLVSVAADLAGGRPGRRHREASLATRGAPIFSILLRNVKEILMKTTRGAQILAFLLRNAKGIVIKNNPRITDFSFLLRNIKEILVKTTRGEQSLAFY